MRQLFSTRRTIIFPAAIFPAALAVAAALSPLTATGQQQVSKPPTSYRTVQVDGLSIFYRDAGPKDTPAILLLHGRGCHPKVYLGGKQTVLHARQERVEDGHGRGELWCLGGAGDNPAVADTGRLGTVARNVPVHFVRIKKRLGLK